MPVSLKLITICHTIVSISCSDFRMVLWGLESHPGDSTKQCSVCTKYFSLNLADLESNKEGWQIAFCMGSGMEGIDRQLNSPLMR